jgi:hypothetical protein
MAGNSYIYGRKEDLVIGQSDCCDVRISDVSSYDSDILAYIVADDGGTSWRLIRSDESVRILVNGESLHLVHYLNIGDRLVFGEDKTVYRFAGAEPLKRAEDGISGLKKMTMLSVAAAVLLAAVLSVGLHLRIDPDDEIRRSEVRRYESSLFKIAVKEVIYQQVSLTDQGLVCDTIGRIALDMSVPSGTCFLCTDGKLVTARHCIEPWIVADEPASLYDSYDSDDNLLTVWAADAETYNVLHGKDPEKTYKRLVSVCEVSRDGVVLGTVSSDTCFFNIRNDVVRNLRGVRNPLYWRELGHIRSRSSLGDIAYFQTMHKGSISLAEESYVDSLEAGTPAAHLGYPLGRSESSFERSLLTLRRQKDRCLEFKDTDVAKGYSGGPVMVRHNRKLYAVGVLSRVFDQNQRSCVCVPSSEILNAGRRWEE